MIGERGWRVIMVVCTLAVLIMGALVACGEIEVEPRSTETAPVVGFQPGSKCEFDLHFDSYTGNLTGTVECLALEKGE